MEDQRQGVEVRNKDNKLLFVAEPIHGDIILTLKSAGKEIKILYTDIPKLVSTAAKRKKRLENKTERMTDSVHSPKEP